MLTSVNKRNVVFVINDQLQGPSAVFWERKDTEHLPRPRVGAKSTLHAHDLLLLLFPAALLVALPTNLFNLSRRSFRPSSVAHFFFVSLCASLSFTITHSHTFQSSKILSLLLVE